MQRRGELLDLMAVKRETSWNKIEVKATLLYEGKPKEGGIYQILHKENRRKYIGSAGVFEIRWQSHLSELRKGTHHNKFLQNDFNKSGEDKFEFSIVEIVSGTRDERLKREQFYLDLLWEECSLDANKKYNHVRTAVITLPRIKKNKIAINWNWFLGPDGKEYVVETLDTFCKIKELSFDEMTKLVSREITEYKGWSIREKSDIFKVIVNKETGIEIDTSSETLASVAIKIGMSSTSHLSKLLIGKRKSVGSWSVKNRVYVPRPNKGKVCRLLSPDNEIFDVNNIKLFAKEHDLNIDSLRCVANGDKLEHRGWIKYFGESSRTNIDTEKAVRWRAKYDKQAKSYHLVNPDGVITEIFNMSRFCRERGMHKSYMFALYKGRWPTAYGWTRAPEVAT